MDDILSISTDPFADLGVRADDYELIRGVLREVGGLGGLSGATGSELLYWLTRFVKEHNLGIVSNAKSFFQLSAKPRTILKPDISFVSTDRLPFELSEGICNYVPDLAVYLASLSDRQSETIDKVALFLAGGTRLVWLARPQEQTVTVFRPDEPEQILTRDEDLDGGDVLPGFRLSLAELFRPRGRFAR